MTIVYKILTQPPHKGAFVAGDTVRGITSYAYPGSMRANSAHGAHPETVAAMMIAHERSWSRKSPSIPAYDARNWQLLKGK